MSERTRTNTSVVPFTGPSRTIAEKVIDKGKALFGLRRMVDLGEDNSEVRIEEIVDVEKDLEEFSQKTIEMLNPQIIYKSENWYAKQTGLLGDHYEKSVSCIDGDSVIINLISPSVEGNIRKRETTNRRDKDGKFIRKYNLCHLGLVMVGIKGLAREGLGTKALICLYDSRFGDMTEATIAQMDADLSDNIGLFYCAPNLLNAIR